MARFNDAWMDMLIAKNDIVSVVSSYVPLKSKGRNLWGLCPFHNEKTPSFSVAPDKQMYYCFGCGAGGGAIQFIMAIERLNFYDAVSQLAQRANMEMPDEIDDAALQRERARKERLYEACKLAAKFFHAQLLQDEGEAARNYLAGRGLSGAIVQRFGLGYALDSWDKLIEHLTGQGFFEHELIEAGLAIKNAKSGRVYDAYRNRVIFPIIGTNARVLGFGARAMGDETPKYINTSDTPIYNKRSNLYALNGLKGKKLSDILVVEGYMDAISLHAAGIENTVASLGTSLTAQQARLLKRYAPNAYIAYDGDAAGQNATLRGLDILQKEGLHVKVIVLPDGLDPDDFVRQRGKEAFDALRDNALTLNAFKIEHLATEYDLTTEDGRQGYAAAGCLFIAGLQPVEQERYYTQLSRKSGMTLDILRAQGARYGSEHTGQSKYVVPLERTAGLRQEEKDERRLAEKSLIYALVQSPEQSALLADITLDKLFSEETYAHMAGQIIANPSQQLDIAKMMSELAPEEAGRVAEALEGEASIANARQYVLDCIARIRRVDTLSEIRLLQARAADEAMPLADKLTLIAKINELKKRV